MKGTRYPQELIDKIIEEIKLSGKSVIEVATENGLNPKTVYKWVRKASTSSTSTNNLILENKRLKKEKQELIELIGRLSIDVDKLNKKKDQLL